MLQRVPGACREVSEGLPGLGPDLARTREGAVESELYQKVRGGSRERPEGSSRWVGQRRTLGLPGSGPGEPGSCTLAGISSCEL